MRILLVDPSLFTEPYDSALSKGLEENGIEPFWAIRGARADELIDLPMGRTLPLFYPLTDGAARERHGSRKWLKGIEHPVGLARLVRQARRLSVAALHFQWSTLPPFDLVATRVLRRRMPVILTVHDLTPFNGVKVSGMQLRGLDALMREVDHLIVHTEKARDELVGRGLAADRVSIVAHGPLPLRCTPRPLAPTPGRTRLVLFGRLQSYKGLDILIEALGRLDEAGRARLEIVVAGEPFIPLDPLRARAAQLGIDGRTLAIRPERLSEQEMADLLHSADGFLYPYLAIEASGVFHLTAGLGKWTIASALGSFRQALAQTPQAGRLVAPGDVEELADALKQCVGGAPASVKLADASGWGEIGARTRRIYEMAIARHAE